MSDGKVHYYTTNETTTVQLLILYQLLVLTLAWQQATPCLLPL